MLSPIDFANGYCGGYSIAPGSSRGNDGAITGSAVDMGPGDGPVHACHGLGDSGTGGSYSAAFKLQESEDGTNDWTDIENGHAAVLAGGGSVSVASGVATVAASSQGANDLTTVGQTTGHRSKRYVRTVCTIDITAGSSSGTDIPVSSCVFSQKKVA